MRQLYNGIMSYRRRRASNPSSVIVMGMLAIVAYWLLYSQVHIDLGFLALTIEIMAVCVVVLALVLWWLPRYQAKKRWQAITAAQVDRMSGEDFEQFLGALLRSRGFSVAFTRRSGDFGADIVASKDGARYSIQAKRRRRSIDRSAIADAVGAMALYHCSKSMVITSSYFTNQAKQFAKANNCQLVDRDQLADWISAFSPARPETAGTTSSRLGYTLSHQHGEQLARQASQQES